ncbi:carbon starvation protein CstA [Shewanella mangrovisoli]|uniref:Carbon starvation protein CstA n=1 Tax=Shewanella mangrovisoli TaxID=2864211 RepID=A0ABV4VJP7_9GAMM
MRTLQLFGFMLTVAGIILATVMFAPVDSETSEASAGASGLGFLFMVLPMLGCSALMLVPSSTVLFFRDVRRRTYFAGHFWLNLWKVNLVISLGYIALLFYLVFVWLKISGSH